LRANPAKEVARRRDVVGTGARFHGSGPHGKLEFGISAANAHAGDQQQRVGDKEIISQESKQFAFHAKDPIRMKIAGVSAQAISIARWGRPIICQRPF
jgi:hypothetical protein